MRPFKLADDLVGAGPAMDRQVGALREVLTLPSSPRFGETPVDSHPRVGENGPLREKIGHLEVRFTRGEEIAVQGIVSALLRGLFLEGPEPKPER